MAAMDCVRNAVHGMKDVLLMVLVQAATAVATLLYKMALGSGMSSSALVAYRLIFGSAFMVPLALVVERKDRPKLTWKVLVQGFFSGLLGGAVAQNMLLESLSVTSATFVVAVLNLMPGMTFLLAIFFRQEKLKLGTMAGKAKVAGTLMGIGGAMLLAFYRGPEIRLWETHLDLLKKTSGNVAHSPPAHKSGNMALGFALSIGSCIFYSLWFILQAKISADYPVPYSSTALMSFMGSIQAVVYALCRERHRDQWRLRWDIRLLTVSYAGVFLSGICIILYTWCLRSRGPMFASAFNPLQLVIVAFVASLVLEEKLYTGSVLGAVLIVAGLYMIIWGKRKEMSTLNQSKVSSTDSVELSNNHSHAPDIVISSPKTADDRPKDGGSIKGLTVSGST